MNILEPPAYVVSAPKKFEQKQPQIAEVKNDIDINDRLSTLLLSRAPNTKKSNGRINCDGVYEKGLSATVSPFNDRFRSQIEDGVYPFVEALLQKNYFPISSCQGHTDGLGDYFEIILAIPSVSLAEEIANFIKIRGCKITISESTENAEIKFLNTTSIRHEVSLKKDQNVDKTDYREINILYKRNYSFYTFLTISLFDQGFNAMTFSNFFKVLERKLLFSYTKKKLLEIIKDPKFPESIY